jgi:hypothetical protein
MPRIAAAVSFVVACVLAPAAAGRALQPAAAEATLGEFRSDRSAVSSLRRCLLPNGHTDCKPTTPIRASKAMKLIRFFVVVAAVALPSLAAGQGFPPVGEPSPAAVQRPAKPAQRPKAPAAPKAPAVDMGAVRACLAIDDMSKERLDCYDAVVAPEPKAGAKAAKRIADCRYLREEDERLGCFNKFASAPAATTGATARPKTRRPAAAIEPPPADDLPPPR